MTPKYFQVTSADMQPTLLKDDVIEGFKVKVRNMFFLKGVYVIILNSRTLICRVRPGNQRGGNLKVICDGGKAFKVRISQIREVYRVDRLVNRHIK